MCYSAMVKRDLRSLDWSFGSHWIRNSFPEYEERLSREPKLFPPLSARIFPNSYAAIVHRDPSGALRLDPMRYSAYPPAFINEKNRYTSFNARRDNLQSAFWSEAYRQHHGFIVVSEFFEWVAVSDLLQAGRVSMAAVKAEFQAQAAARKARVLAEGKAYRPTPTEKKVAEQRKIIISFRPEQAKLLLTPVIFSQKLLASGDIDYGFAIITDEPPPEVLSAGHDRCPVYLTEPAAAAWLQPEGRSAQQLDALLEQRPALRFMHELAFTMAF